MAPVELLSLGATLALNAGFAWLTGSLLTRIWLGRAQPRLLEQCAPRFWLGDALAGAACFGGSLLAIWAAAAMMGDVALAEAWGMLPQVLAQTAYGHSAMGAMAAAFLLLATIGLQRARPARAALLLAFALARASMSHAGEHGMLSVAVGIECAHLLLLGVWLGVVALAAWVVLPNREPERAPVAPYLAQCSRCATIALAGIVASGAFNLWQRLDSPNQLIDTPYGLALTAKLALFALAVMLGAYNRYVGFPMLARNEGGHAQLVLRVESVVLLAALAAAAVVTAQAPPG